MQDTYTGWTLPGFNTTSILYLEPVSSFIVRVCPNRDPSALKNTGPSFGWIFNDTQMLINAGTSAMMKKLVITGLWTSRALPACKWMVEGPR